MFPPVGVSITQEARDATPNCPNRLELWGIGVLGVGSCQAGPGTASADLVGRFELVRLGRFHDEVVVDARHPWGIAGSVLRGLTLRPGFDCPGHASIATTLNIYTHVVDASHRKAIEAVERELFAVLDHSGLQTVAGLESAPPASDSVN